MKLDLNINTITTVSNHKCIELLRVINDEHFDKFFNVPKS